MSDDKPTLPGWTKTPSGILVQQDALPGPFSVRVRGFQPPQERLK